MLVAAHAAGTQTLAPVLTPPALIAAHLGLVRKTAWQVHSRLSRAIDIEDLIQIGMMALIQAAHAYVPQANASFAAYAVLRIRGAMIDDLRRHANMTRGAIIRRKKVQQAQGAVERRTGRPANLSEVAVELDMDASEVGRWMVEAQSQHVVPIDDAYSDHSVYFADPAEAQDMMLERAQTAAALADSLKQLPEREAQILQLYFIEELTLEEIGELLGVGAARVCQIKKAALEKLNRKLKPMVA